MHEEKELLLQRSPKDLSWFYDRVMREETLPRQLPAVNVLFGMIGAIGSYVFFPLGQDFGRRVGDLGGLSQADTQFFVWFFGLTSIVPTALLGYMSASKHGGNLLNKICRSADASTEYPAADLQSFWVYEKYLSTSIILLLSFYAGLQRMYLTQDSSSRNIGLALMAPAFISAFSVYYSVYDSYKHTVVNFAHEKLCLNKPFLDQKRLLLESLQRLSAVVGTVSDDQVLNIYNEAQTFSSAEQQFNYLLSQSENMSYEAVAPKNMTAARLLTVTSYVLAGLGAYAYYPVGGDAAKYYFTDNKGYVEFSAAITFLTLWLMYGITTSLYLPRWVMPAHAPADTHHTRHPCMRLAVNKAALFFGCMAGIPPVDLAWQAFEDKDPSIKWPLIILFGLSSFISQAAFTTFAVASTAMQFFDAFFKVDYLPLQDQETGSKKRALLLGIVHRAQHDVQKMSGELCEQLNPKLDGPF